MQKRIASIILLLFSFISIGNIVAQCDTSRYKSEIFSDIEVKKDVQYGSAPVWSVPYNDKDLYMDIYLPKNDTLTTRPLMVWIHSGGFLTGSKDADDVTAICDSFARRGYVAVTIEYRMGFNPTSASSAERAVYRGVQDTRAAIRFLKEKWQTYGIDTNYTFVGGFSAGGFAALQTVYMDQNEAPSSIASGAGYPALGCLDCRGNSYKHSMDITGYASMWGAVGDSTWIDGNETTYGLLVHGKADGTVPFGVGHPFGVPTTPITHGSRCVDNQLDFLGIDHENYFVAGQDHGFHGGDNGNWSPSDPPTPYWDTIFYKIQDMYGRLLEKPTVPIVGFTKVCTNDTITYQVQVPQNFNLCWEVNGGTLISEENNTIQVVFNNPGQASIHVKEFSEIAKYNGKESLSIQVIASPTVNFNYTISGMKVAFNPLSSTGFVNYIWNFGDGASSSQKAPTHQYQAPGFYEVSLQVKDQYGCSAVQTKTVDFSHLNIAKNKWYDVKIYPNPAHKRLHIAWRYPIKGRVNIYTVTGKLKKSKPIKQGEQKLDFFVEDLPVGMYWVEIPTFEKYKKLIIR